MPSDADAVAATCTAAIAAAIAVEGPLRFDQVMEHALYGRGGFYTSGGQAGRRGGDFITSPEVGPLFGDVVARWIEAEYRRVGEPDGFTVIEFGAGPGTLARTIRASGRLDFGTADRQHTTGRQPMRYVAVELSAAQRAAHPDWVISVESLSEAVTRGSLPDGRLVGVVIANELLDNLPFRLLVFDGAWREALADLDRDGRVVEVLSAPVDPLPLWLPRAAPHGARVPWQQAAADWVAEIVGCLHDGAVLVFDYVTPTTGELATVPWRSWLRTFRDHARGAHYLSELGLQDITTQVALDQLLPPSVVRSQSQFLQLWGITDLVDEGRVAWAAAASSPTVAAMKMRSRISEAEALLDHAGLGAFSALEWRVAEPAAASGSLR